MTPNRDWASDIRVEEGFAYADLYAEWDALSEDEQAEAEAAAVAEAEAAIHADWDARYAAESAKLSEGFGDGADAFYPEWNMDNPPY